jgi:hypothetical protein
MSIQQSSLNNLNVLPKPVLLFNHKTSEKKEMESIQKLMKHFGITSNSLYTRLAKGIVVLEGNWQVKYKTNQTKWLQGNQITENMIFVPGAPRGPRNKKVPSTYRKTILGYTHSTGKERVFNSINEAVEITGLTLHHVRKMLNDPDNAKLIQKGWQLKYIGEKREWIVGDLPTVPVSNVVPMNETVPANWKQVIRNLENIYQHLSPMQLEIAKSLVKSVTDMEIKFSIILGRMFSALLARNNLKTIDVSRKLNMDNKLVIELMEGKVTGSVFILSEWCDKLGLSFAELIMDLEMEKDRLKKAGYTILP